MEVGTEMLIPDEQKILRRMRKDLGIVLRHDDPERLARHRDRMRLRRQLEIKLDGQLPARYVWDSGHIANPTRARVLRSTPL